MTRSWAINYECGECGGRVHHLRDRGDTTELKCGECGSIGLVKPGLVRAKLDGLRRR